MENTIQPGRRSYRELKRNIPILLFVFNALMSIKQYHHSANRLLAIHNNRRNERIVNLDSEFTFEECNRVPIFLHVIENHGLPSRDTISEDIVRLHLNDDGNAFFVA